MPREKINHAAPFTPVPDDCVGPAIHGESWPEPEVHLQWNREGDHGYGHAQVGIDLPRKYLLNLAEELERNADAPSVLAFSPVLGRPELNRLIQVARRARDQAYGRDE